MSKIDFNAMTLDEAKRYFLEHRDDQEAFYAYMDKLRASGRAIQIDPTDPESASLSKSDSSRAPASKAWGWLKGRAAGLRIS